jgi:hypothetical protein
MTLFGTLHYYYEMQFNINMHTLYIKQQHGISQAVRVGSARGILYYICTIRWKTCNASDFRWLAYLLLRGKTSLLC